MITLTVDTGYVALAGENDELADWSDAELRELVATWAHGAPGSLAYRALRAMGERTWVALNASDRGNSRVYLDD